jgi:hypothetical protein
MQEEKATYIDPDSDTKKLPDRKCNVEKLSGTMNHFGLFLLFY